MRICVNSIFLLSGLLAGTNAAWCDDFLSSGASARSMGAGGAYLPGSRSALDAMAINPAGLSLLNARTVEISVAGMSATGRFVNSANSDGRLSSRGVVPYGAFGAPIGQSRFSIGFAALPELMSSAKWRYTDTPGGVGGVSYGLRNHTSEIVV